MNNICHRRVKTDCPMMCSCDLSIIIVNYNTRNYLARCLDSLAGIRGCRAEILVVDNASSDSTREMLPVRFPEVTVIANTENRGFAGANNQAIAVSKGRYLFFLNPDAEVLPGAIEPMTAYMDQHPGIGLAGTRLVHPDGSEQSSVEARYPGQKHARRELNGLKGNIAWVLGASMIARREAVTAVGGFSEEFFLYGEEQDLCLKLRRAGWEIGYIPHATVLHWGGMSERHHPPAEVWEKKFRAELIFYRKHYSRRALRHICLENLVQSAWRMVSIRLTLPFYADPGPLRWKLDKYRVAFRVFGSAL